MADIKENSIDNSITVLGASTMARTGQNSLSLASPSREVEGVATEIQSVRKCSVSITSSVDVSSATQISVP